jgi:hypothetical protein
MSDPEIDRRCASCGASVRSHALFCPQCGQPIAHADAPTNVVDTGQTVPIPREAHWDPAETRPLMSMPDFSETKPLVPAPTLVPQEAPNPEPINPQPAGIAKESVRERVDKIRKVSSVVIDQAAYDPSLRFILVAAALFLLFLFLLIVSKVLG